HTARQAAPANAATAAEAARLHLLATSTSTSTTSAPDVVASDPAASGTSGIDPGNAPVPDVPAPSAGAAAAVAYAKAQLGKPYQYAGVGPDSFDCSGLTMM